MAGRKSKLTREVIGQLANLLSQGSTEKDACAITGISKTLYYSWINQAESIENGGGAEPLPFNPRLKSLLLEFIDSIRRAKSNSYAISVNEIRRAGSPYWRHTITGKIVYREPAAITYMNRFTGELIFERPADMEHWEQQLSGTVWNFTEGKWQANAWYLERSNSEEWGRKDDVNAKIEPVEFIIRRVDGDNASQD